MVTLLGSRGWDTVVRAIKLGRIASLAVAPLVGHEHFRLLICPFRDGSGFLVMRDVTLSVLRRNARYQSRKLESLGQLAGSLAHEFNNLLQPIIGMAQLALEDHGGDPDLDEDLTVIISSARQMAELVRGILAYVRRTPVAQEMLPLADIVKQEASKLNHCLPSGAMLEIEPVDSDVASTMVKGSRIELAQVLRNLVSNAVDATASASRVRIGIEMCNVDGLDSVRLDLPPGSYLALIVADDGPGIPPEVLARVLEPFFTTKELGKGTGLGLPIVQGIAKSWGGNIDIASVYGCGTKVAMLLPIAD